MKKLLALVLSLVMALSLIPTVWGTDGGEKDVFTRLREAGYQSPETEPRMMFPTGLVRYEDYDYTYENGVLTIMVMEGSEQNWETAYWEEEAGYGNLTVTLFAPVPDANVVRTSRPLNGNIPDGQVNSFISGTGIDYTNQVLKTPGTDVDIAAINEKDDTVTIAPVEEGDMYFVVLYDQDDVENNGNETKWLIQYRVVMEKDFVHRIALPQAEPVDASRIAFDDMDNSKWSVSVQNGLVTVQALDPTITERQYVGCYIVSAPGGYYDKNNNSGVGNGFWGPGVTKLRFIWFDQSGTRHLETLTIIVRAVIPYMQADCTAVDQIKLPNLPSGGVQVVYDKSIGMYHTSFNSSIMPTIEELTATMQLDVPEGAKSYRYLPKRTTEDPRVSGDSTYLSALKQTDIHQVEDQSGYVLPIANIGKLTLDEDKLTVYYATTQAFTVRVIQWYSDEAGTETMGDPVYVFGYNDGFVWSTTTESVSQVTGAVTAPVLEGQTGLTLTGVRYPQESSGNTLYIELSASGDVGDSNVVYLPYSYFDGLSCELAVERKLPDPVIHHYNEARSEYTDIRGEYTEYGIKFETPSFSPFTVTCAPLRGDVNGDGKEPDITDVACLYEQLLTGGGDTKWEGKMLDAALDVNGDGQADVYDLQRLYEYVSGIDSKW